jgi:hypothetical protein
MNVPIKVNKVGSGEVIEPDVDGFVFKPPLCVFCNAPWTADMVRVSAEVELENGYYGETYLSGQGFAVVDITCKLIWSAPAHSPQFDKPAQLCL